MKNKNRNLGKLKLHKNTISNLARIRGGEAPNTDTGNVTVVPGETIVYGNTCTTDWQSELYSACNCHTRDNNIDCIAVSNVCQLPDKHNGPVR